MDYPPRMAGGTTIHVYEMARHFVKLGHTPHIIAASHPKAPKIEHGDIEIRRVRRPYTLFSALAAGRILKELDVIHGHGTCAYGFMRMYRFPTVIKMHSTWLEEYTRYKLMGRRTGLMRLYVHMDRYCATHAHAVIAISNVIKNETMRYGVSEEKITVIHNGIDPEPFSRATGMKDQLGLNDKLVIGYIGRLAPHKGVLTLAWAFKDLAEQYEDLHLLVVGDGPEKMGMASVLKDLAGRVTFIGYVPHHTVPEYYATADIIVYPTLYEPLGNVVLEAMAAGKPLIATATGGIPEILSKECGVMIRPPEDGNPAELKRALEQLIESPNLRKKMSNAGRKNISRFSWLEVCRRTIEVIETVLRA